MTSTNGILSAYEFLGSLRVLQVTHHPTDEKIGAYPVVSAILQDVC